MLRYGEWQQKNHMKDEHATVAMQTKKALDDHMIDENRHSGEAPGRSGTAKTVGIAGGVGGGLLILAEVLRQWLTGS